MPYYCLPTYITKTALDADKSTPEFSAMAMDPKAPPPRVSTCTHCAQNIAADGPSCDKPELTRCENCSSNSHSACTLVPSIFNGRIERLYELYDFYSTAVANAGTAHTCRTDARVRRTGVKLARFQKLYNDQWAHYSGVDHAVALPTHESRSKTDLMALHLVESRRIATALEGLVDIASALHQKRNLQ